MSRETTEPETNIKNEISGNILFGISVILALYGAASVVVWAFVSCFY